MPVSVNGTNGGSVTLTSGAAASATTLTLPNVSGTVLHTGTTVTPAQGGTGLTSVGTAGNILTSDGTAWTSTAPAATGLPTATAVGHIPFSTNGSTYTATQKIVQGTAQASTSGTSIDFTSIPSWVKRITVMLNGVSTNGTSIPQVQIGAGSFTTSGYVSSAASVSSSPVITSATTGFLLVGQGNAANLINGLLTIYAVGSNLWVASVSGSISTVVALCGGGNVTLGGTLDRVRITTVNGTDTFDAGSINILYE